jgi:Inner membrane protein YqiJ, N-terminal/Inner membrane protein YqiJ, OB-fold
MMADFFAAENLPFAVALCLVGLIALVEIAGLVFGFSASGAIDSQIPDLGGDLHFDADADGASFHADVHAPDGLGPGPLSQVLSWLCVGRVPILVLLVVLFCAYGVFGFIVQSVATSLVGTPLPAALASVPALLLAFPATRYAGLGLARVIPKEETEAVSQEEFVGKIAVITRGEARRGLPAEAKVRDQHGQAHYLQVVPDDDAATFKQGVEVLVVQHTGGVYRVIANSNLAMSDRLP